MTAAQDRGSASIFRRRRLPGALAAIMLGLLGLVGQPAVGLVIQPPRP